MIKKLIGVLVAIALLVAGMLTVHFMSTGRDADQDVRIVTLERCWDINDNAECDNGEDKDGDGFCTVKDCRVPAGTGTPGLSCWDLNDNAACDLATEDTNGDKKCSALDCRGMDGADGYDGDDGVCTDCSPPAEEAPEEPAVEADPEGPAPDVTPEEPKPPVDECKACKADCAKACTEKCKPKCEKKKAKKKTKKARKKKVRKVEKKKCEKKEPKIHLYQHVELNGVEANDSEEEGSAPLGGPTITITNNGGTVLNAPVTVY